MTHTVNWTCKQLAIHILPLVLRGVELVEADVRVQSDIAANAAILGPGFALLAHPLGLKDPHQVPATVKSDHSQ